MLSLELFFVDNNIHLIFSSQQTTLLLLKKYMNAAKPPEQSKGLGVNRNIGCKNKNSTWYQKGTQCYHIGSTKQFRGETHRYTVH